MDASPGESQVVDAAVYKRSRAVAADPARPYVDGDVVPGASVHGVELDVAGSWTRSQACWSYTIVGTRQSPCGSPATRGRILRSLVHYVQGDDE
jgi:hypothetical protein